MKTLAKILFSVFVAVFAIETDAQVTGTNADPKTTPQKMDESPNKDAYAWPITPGTNSPRLLLEGVEGPVYVGADWPQGIVELRDGSVINTYLLRYNSLADQMQFINGKDTLAFASPQELKKVSFSGLTFVYETYKCENTIRQGYFELIEPGRNKLLLKKVVTYQIPDDKNPLDESVTRYMVDDRYFISKAGNPAVVVVCNRKSALSILNDHKDAIEEYLKITGNKVRNPEDLKKLVAYYNALDEHE